MRFSIALAMGGLALTANAQGPPGRHGFGDGGFPEARFLGAEAGPPGQVVKGAPYSADSITESTQVLADGNRLHQVTTARVYRDSQGRTRREQSLDGLRGLAANATLPQVIFLNDPVAGVNYALNLSNKTATRTRWARPGFPGRPAGGGPEQARPGAKTESLGTQTMEGVAAQGTRITRTIAAGEIGNQLAIQVVTERWFAPDLNVFVMTRHSDPRSGETVTRLTNISRAEPSAALLQLPSDFRIVDAPGHPWR